MDESQTSESNIPQTKFDQEVLLTNKQFKEYLDLFTFSVRSSISKTAKNELPPCSDTELKEKLTNYLNQNKNE